MDFTLAKEAEQALIAVTQRLSPKERLNAFLAHCRLMMELHERGKQMRSQSSQAEQCVRVRDAGPEVRRFVEGCG